MERVPLEHPTPEADAGQSAVEFAVILSVVLLILLGLLTCAVAFSNWNSLTYAATAGAHQVALSRGQTNDPCAAGAAAVYAAAPNLAQASITFQFVLNGVSYTGASCGASTGAAANLMLNQTAQVILTYPCSVSVDRLYTGPRCTLRAQTTQRVQ